MNSKLGSKSGIYMSAGAMPVAREEVLAGLVAD